MALEVRILRDAGSSPAALVADRRLWLTADRAAVVEEGDPRAAFLLAGLGGEIHLTEVQRLGLGMVDGRIMALASMETEAKARPASANKARHKGEDK